MQAIILAGGLGTRLRSVLADVPKPMAPLQGKPFLAYLIDYLVAQGITEIVLSVHYLREQIQAYFQDSYSAVSSSGDNQVVKISYAIENEPLGTGGAILNSLSLVDAAKPVFVLNGDTFLKIDYRAMYAQHQGPLSLALRKVADCSRYGVVTVEQGLAVEFNDLGNAHPGLINAGVYLINPLLFSALELPQQFSFERDFLFPKMPMLRPQAFQVDDYFIDIGIPEDYARAVKELVK